MEMDLPTPSQPSDDYGISWHLTENSQEIWDGISAEPFSSSIGTMRNNKLLLVCIKSLNYRMISNAALGD